MTRFEWERAFIASGSAPALTRLVGLIIAMHTDGETLCGFPSVDTIARKSGLSKKSCITHIAKLAKLGWVRRTYRGKAAGQQWRNAVYELVIPAEGGERRTPPYGQGGEADTPASDQKVVNLAPKVVYDVPEGGVPDDQKVVYDVHPITSLSRQYHVNDHGAPSARDVRSARYRNGGKAKPNPLADMSYGEPGDV